MPFDSNGVFSLTPGYLAVTGQTILPTNHNPPLEDISAQGLSQVLVRDGRAPMIGNLNMGGFKATNLLAGTSTTDAVNKGQLDAASSKYLLKAAGYTAVLGDNTATIRFTAAATLALATAASLGSGWKINVVADGGVVTIDPNAAETINGQTTFLVPNGSSAEIICDGSNFFTVIKPFSWEPIDGGIKTAAGGTTAISWINLSAYKRLRLSWDIIPTGMTFGMGFRTSSNNGSSYDSGASDYRFHGTSEVNGAVSAIVDTLQSNFPLNSAGMNNSSAASGVIDIFNFNSTTNCNVMSRAHGISSAPALRAENINGIILVAGSRNALQLFSGAGTFSGTFQLEGVRG